MATTDKEKGCLIFIVGFGSLILIAWAWSALFGLGVDFEDAESVKNNMQGTWIVHIKDGATYDHARLIIKGDKYIFRFKAGTARENFENWMDTEKAEGTFAVQDIRTYTNSTEEYRPIIFYGSDILSDVATRKILFDETFGLFWGQWGEMKED